MFKKLNKQNIRYIVTVLTILFIIIIININQPVIYKQLDDWMLIPRPERITELYINKHTELPTTYRPGQQQNISFTIHNIEFATIEYNYVIIQLSEDKTVSNTLEQGKISLNQDQSEAIDKTITMLDMGNRSQVQIRIDFDSIPFGESNKIAQSQVIHYWTNKER